MNKIFSHRFVQKTRAYTGAHKTLTVLAALILSGASYWTYGMLTGTAGVTRYILEPVEKGTVVVSVSGTGQVSALNQVDVKSKVSGDVVWVGVKVGQEVGRGDALMSLDDTDARKAVTDAALDLTETKLQWSKASAQAPIDYERKLESLETAKDNLATEHKTAFNTVSKVFLDLPSIVTGIDGILFSMDIDARSNQWNLNVYKNLFTDADAELVTALADIAERDYRTARAEYDKSFLDFKSVTVRSDDATLEKSLSGALSTTESIAQAAKSENNLLDTIVDISGKRNRKVSSVIIGYQTSLKSYLGAVNTHISSLSSEESAIKNDRESVLNINRDLTILKVGNPSGVKPIDLQISENGILKKEAALQDLKRNLSDYVIRAPFGGIVAKAPVKAGDTLGVGASAATLITKQKQASISLNEVDAAKVAVGQKATITFDAIDGLKIAGEVAEVDTVGAVSQGVVTYSMTIAFDTQDERVKPGMSLSVAIITDAKTDVLVVPNSAVKSQGALSYVEVPVDAEPRVAASGNQGTELSLPPRRQMVGVGLSNDTETEIISGVTEGDLIITRTIAPSANKTATSQTPNIFSAAGVRGGGSAGNRTFVR